MKTDTPLTRGNRGSFYELVDKDGKVYGRYNLASTAAIRARFLWPDQEQDEDRTGKGWDIQAIR